MSEWIEPVNITTIFLGLCGWFVVHRLTAWRERVNHKRKVRTDFLIDACRQLAQTSKRQDDASLRIIENVIADIQIFGSRKQALLAVKLCKELSCQPEASTNNLLNSLRNDLRKELDCKYIDGDIHYFRYGNFENKVLYKARMDERYGWKKI